MGTQRCVFEVGMVVCYSHSLTIRCNTACRVTGMERTQHSLHSQVSMQSVTAVAACRGRSAQLCAFLRFVPVRAVRIQFLNRPEVIELTHAVRPATRLPSCSPKAPSKPPHPLPPPLSHYLLPPSIFVVLVLPSSSPSSPSPLC